MVPTYAVTRPEKHICAFLLLYYPENRLRRRTSEHQDEGVWSHSAVPFAANGRAVAATTAVSQSYC